MLVEIVGTFKKLSDGSILRPGDILDLDEEKALRLIEKGRARLLPSGTHGNAPKNDSGGSGEAPLPRGDETPLPARFRVGDWVRFAHRRALNILEGVVIESKWHPAPIRAWWYRVETTDGKFWVGESHIQGGVHAKRD